MGFKMVNKHDVIQELRDRLREQFMSIPKDYGLKVEDLVIKDDMLSGITYMSDSYSWLSMDVAVLPTGYPIGDVDDEYEKDMKIYIKTMKDRVLNPEGKYFGVDYSNGQGKSVTHEHKCCNNVQNHKKVWLITSFYIQCKVCGKDWDFEG